MDFGQALTALKGGQWVARSGWNGKGMYLSFRPGKTTVVNNETGAQLGVNRLAAPVTFLPYIMMCTAQGTFVPWLASQTDILADDWGEVQLHSSSGVNT